MDLLRNIVFDQPWFLALAPLVLLWMGYLWKKRSQSKGFLVSSNNRMEGADWVNKSTWLPDLLRALSMLLFVVAIARPQVTLEEEIMKGEGIDIMMTMDLSSSMLTEDFNPNRLVVSKEVAEKFINSRPYDRIGLTVFSKEAFTQCPLTIDHEVLKSYLSGIQVGMLNDGTAIGMGLATAINRLIESESVSKIVILLTDGENTAGYIDPLTAAEIAQEYGIKVYTIGVGGTGNSRIPGGISGNIFSFGIGRSKVDEKLLTQIADLTGGKYFRAKDEEGLIEIYSEIDRLEKSEIDINAFKRYKDKYRVFLGWGVGLLLFSILLDRLIYKSL